jgi:hypothetical protein
MNLSKDELLEKYMRYGKPDLEKPDGLDWCDYNKYVDTYAKYYTDAIITLNQDLTDNFELADKFRKTLYEHIQNCKINF